MRSGRLLCMGILKQQMRRKEETWDRKEEEEDGCLFPLSRPWLSERLREVMYLGPVIYQRKKLIFEAKRQRKETQTYEEEIAREKRRQKEKEGLLDRSDGVSFPPP